MAVHGHREGDAGAGSVAAPAQEAVTGAGHRRELHDLAKVIPDLGRGGSGIAGRICIDGAKLGA